MRHTPRGRRVRALALLTAAATAAVSLGSFTPASAHGRPGDHLLDGNPRFYVEPNTNAAQQAQTWQAEGRAADAALMRKLARIPQAIWLTGGTPDEIQARAAEVTRAAARQHTVPILVIYNVPGRDCSQYSAGGAADEQAYQAFIDGVSRGIGNRSAVVVVEPDGIALLPSEPWCTDFGGGSSGLPEDRTGEDIRFREIRYAVERLHYRNPSTAVYIDAGHSAWHAVNDHVSDYGSPLEQLGVANRLLRAGIDKANGFILNVSNYRADEELITYGTNLSKCLYHRARTGAASCSDADLAAVPNRPKKQTHFLLDTSRNGQGPWEAPEGVYTDAQAWCNPPGRGLGARPITRTHNPLIDAFVWIKRPGESDGSCTRGTAGPEDPEYGVVDPNAGAWWGDYALGLAQNAEPALR